WSIFSRRIGCGLPIDPDRPLLHEPPALRVRRGPAQLVEETRQPDPARLRQLELLGWDVRRQLVLAVDQVELALRLRASPVAVVQADDGPGQAALLLIGISGRV